MFGLDKTTSEAFDFNEVLGKAVNETMEKALGAEVWSGTKTTFNKLNRIITTASQIVWTVRSIGDSAREVTEWTAENTGKIGNALKKFRVVGENAYPWMPERVTAQSKWQQRMQRFRDGTESLDDAASSISSVVGEVRSITEEVNEFKEQKEAFDKAIKEATPNSRPDNDSTKATADQSNAASKSPTLQPTDRTKGDAE
jgi:Sec-independent protein translocase protein TatA